MRVVQVISSAGLYGAETMLLQLMSGLRALQCESVLIAFRKSGNPAATVGAESIRRGFATHELPCRGRLDPKAVVRMRRYLREAAPNIVHTHGYKASFYSYLAARPLGIPVVTTCHNWTDRTRLLRLYGRMDRLMLCFSDRIIAVSDEIAGRIKVHTHASRVRVIPNGVAAPGPESLKGRLSDGMTIGMAARLDPAKGAHLLLAAVPEILGHCQTAQFLIAGDGPEQKNLTAEVRRLGLEHRVQLPGFVHDMRAFYESIDVFLLPSLIEGTPMTILEAMSFGKPVIATRTGGIPKVISDGETGLLIDPGDVGQIAAKVVQVAKDPALRERLGRSARIRVGREFSVQRMAESYLDVYSGVARNKETRNNSPVELRIQPVCGRSGAWSERSGQHP